MRGAVNAFRDNILDQAGWYRFISILLQRLFVSGTSCFRWEINATPIERYHFVYPTLVIWDEHGGDRKVLAFLRC